jgi:glycosyltransferase involved in cell wall biosynthesis
MRIGIVAPLVESVPPQLYGGTERVVSVLTEELVRRGHAVTLFASGDSHTDAELVKCWPQSLRLHGNDDLRTEATRLELTEVYRQADDFDLVHNHVDWPAFAFARSSRTPTISTMHGRLDLPEIATACARYPEQALVSISDSQRSPLLVANWRATVHNGIALENFHFQSRPGNYLVFLGRFSPEKRADRAIELATSVGMTLLLAAKVDPADRDYYEAVIAPLIEASPLAEYVGEVDEREKDVLLRGAFAYLFPIDWPEPFGLTMVEAMATGTPVIAWRGGSVAEVVRDGETGFICDSMAEMVEAVARVPEISRAACREHVEERFSGAAMAEAYERVYRELITGAADEACRTLTAGSFKTWQPEQIDVPVSLISNGQGTTT